jgi:hypothetical protein
VSDRGTNFYKSSEGISNTIRCLFLAVVLTDSSTISVESQTTLGEFADDNSGAVICTTAAFANTIANVYISFNGAEVNPYLNYHGLGSGSASSSFLYYPCSAGQYAPVYNVPCQDCSIGKYSESGAEECTDCTAGKYASSAGTATCTDCPDGATTQSPYPYSHIQWNDTASWTSPLPPSLTTGAVSINNCSYV